MNTAAVLIWDNPGGRDLPSSFIPIAGYLAPLAVPDIRSLPSTVAWGGGGGGMGAHGNDCIV